MSSGMTTEEDASLPLPALLICGKFSGDTLLLLPPSHVPCHRRFFALGFLNLSALIFFSVPSSLVGIAAVYQTLHYLRNILNKIDHKAYFSIHSNSLTCG
jgi:hypothetical protein